MQALALSMALALVAPGAPAHRPDPAMLDCISAKVSADARGEIERAAERLIMTSFQPPEGERDALADAAGPVRASARECGAEHGWSAAEVRSAAGYGFFLYGRPGAAKALRNAGIDVTALDTLFAALPASEQGRALTDSAVEGAGPVAALVERARAAGLVEGARAAELARVYFVYLAAISESRHDFEAA